MTILGGSVDTLVPAGHSSRFRLSGLSWILVKKTQAGPNLSNSPVWSANTHHVSQYATPPKPLMEKNLTQSNYFFGGLERC